MSVEENDDIVAHFDALRNVLIKCLKVLAVGFLPIFLVAPYLLNVLLHIITRDNVSTLNYFSPLEVFILQIKTAAVVDILVCFPYICAQFWSFAAPALYRRERRFIKSIILSAGLLFLVGIMFCLFIIMPFIIRFGMSFATAEVHAVFGIGHVISLALRLSIIFGFMFQFPLITYTLIKSKTVDYATMKNMRAYVLVGILIFSALLTPPDVISQLMLSLPTYALFELGLFCGKQ